MNKKRIKFNYQPLFELGIKSNMVNVRNCKGILIGTIEAKLIPSFINQATGAFFEGFTPVNTWKNYFSLELIAELGLDLK